MTYTDWVSMLREDCSRRQKLVQAINASASSSSRWPTVAATETRQGFQRRPEGMASDQNQQSLTTVAMLLPTASAFPNNRWPTPQARDGDPNGRSADPTRVGDPARHGGYNLDDWAAKFTQEVQASAWPTPTTRDYKDTGNLENVPENGLLGRVAANWQTPRSNEVGQYQYSRGDKTKPTPSLTGQAFSLPDLVTYQVGEISSKDRRSLNPLFVEWLMGWPRGWTLLAWTDFACSETELSLFKRRMRSALLQLALPSAAPPAQLGLFI
nr:hypothetical protein [Mesorhizobium sp.]